MRVPKFLIFYAFPDFTKKENIPYYMESQNLIDHDSLNQPFRSNNFKIIDGNSSTLQRRLRKNQVLASLDSQIIHDSVEKCQKDKLNSSAIQNVKGIRNRGEIKIQEEGEGLKQQLTYHSINSKCRLSSLQASQEGNLITANNPDYQREFSKRGNGNISTEPAQSTRVSNMNMRNQKQELLNGQVNQVETSFTKQGSREKISKQQSSSSNNIDTNMNNQNVTENILDEYDSARITFYPKQSQLGLQEQQNQKYEEKVQHEQSPPHRKQRIAQQIRLPSEPQIYGSSGITENDTFQQTDGFNLVNHHRQQSLPPFQRTLIQQNPLRTSHPVIYDLTEKYSEKEQISQGKKEKFDKDQQQKQIVDVQANQQLLKQQPEGFSQSQVSQVNNNMTFHNLFQKNLASGNIPIFGDRKRSVNYTEFDRLGVLQSKQIQTSLSQNSSALSRRNTTAMPIKKCTIRRQKYEEEQNNSLLQAYDPIKEDYTHNHTKKAHKTSNSQQLCISVEQISSDGIGNKDNQNIWNHFSETKQTKEPIIELRRHQHTSDSLSSPLNEYPKNGKRQIIAQHIRMSQNSSSLDASFNRNRPEEVIQTGIKLENKNGLSLESDILVGISKGIDKNGDKMIKNKNSFSSQQSSINSEISKSNRIITQLQQTFQVIEQKEIIPQGQQQQQQQEFNLPSLIDNHQQKRISYLAGIQQYNQQLQQHLAGKSKHPQLNERALSLKDHSKKDNQNIEKSQFKIAQICYQTLNNSPIVKTKTLPQQASENLEILTAHNATENNEDENLLQETGKFGQQNSQQQLNQLALNGAGGSCVGKEWIVSLDNIFKANKRQDIFHKQTPHQHMFSKVMTKKDNSQGKANNNNNSKQDGSQIIGKCKPQLLPISAQDGISKAITENNRIIFKQQQQEYGNTNSSISNGVIPPQRHGTQSTKATTSSNNLFPDPRLGTLLIHYNFPLQDNSISNVNSIVQGKQLQQQEQQAQMIPSVHKKVSSAATCSRKYDFYHDNNQCEQIQNPLNIDIQQPCEKKSQQQRARSSNNRFPREIFTPNVSKAKRMNSQNHSTVQQGQTYQLDDCDNNEFL